MALTPVVSSEIGPTTSTLRSHRLRKSTRRPLVGQATIVVGSWILGASVFFYAQWSSGFNRIMGDDGDARLIVYTNEQWFLALRGAQPWRSPPFFYPTKGLLGYTDSFFLFQIFYAPFRVLGADPFLAVQLTVVALSLVAFVCFVVFVRMAFRTPLFIAVVGALVFTFADNLSGHSGSFQLYGIYFVPPIALLALFSWRARRSSQALSVALAGLVGLLWGLLLFSTYYVAWFSMLAGGIVALLMIILAPRVTVSTLIAVAGTYWRSITACIVGAVVGIIPFLMTYLPVLNEQGARTYIDAISYATRWQDWDNVGYGNLLWAHLVGLSWTTTSIDPYELSYAVTPIIFFTVVGGGAAITLAGLTRKLTMTPMLRFTLALCCTTVILAILPVNTKYGSAWAVVWHIPGASGIRAIDRIEVASDLVTVLALILLATYAMRHWRRLQESMPLRIAGVVLLCLIVVEQGHDSSNTQLVRNRELAALDAVPPVPPGCTSFYVSDTRPNTIPYYQFQTTAMLISQRTGVPTINGYSGSFPPGWGLINPDEPSYPAAVRQWTSAHGLDSGVCNFNLGTNSWVGPPTS